MLTERQVGILKKEKLPIDETRLSQRQKTAISAIEEMFSYLDERYDEKFTYKGYCFANLGEEEHLAVECGIGTVVVYRTDENGKHTYRDNYACLTAAPGYENTIKNLLSGLIPDEYIVHFTVKKIDDTVGNDILRQVSASGVVGIENAQMTNAELKMAAKKYGEWIAPKLCGKAHIVNFYALNPEKTEWYSGFDYTDRLRAAAAGPVILVIDDKGSVRVY